MQVGDWEGTDTRASSRDAFHRPRPIFAVSVPGGIGLPGDTDDDGPYEDVNGNDLADLAGVVLYFNRVTRIARYEPSRSSIAT